MDLRERHGLEPAHRHPWEQSRSRAILRLLRSAGLPHRPRLLDVGCGDGWLAHQLGHAIGAGAIVGVDPELDPGTREALRDGSPPVETVTDIAEAATEAFDVAMLLDVLEHVVDDVGLLRQAARCVRPGGQLLITVPAYPLLYSRHDAFLEHQRRYRRRDLERLMAEAGLERLDQGAWFSSLLLPRVASVLLQRLMSRPAAGDARHRQGFFSWHPRVRGVGHWAHGQAISRPIEVALDLDNRLLSALTRAGMNLPGLSLWARCRRP